MPSPARLETFEFLSEASRLLASSLEVKKTLNQLGHLAVPRIADWCGIDLVVGRGQFEQVVVVHTDPEKVELAHELRRRYPLDPDAPAGVPHVIRTGRPELYERIPEALRNQAASDPEGARISRELGLHSAMIVPLIARGVTLGAISLVSDRPDRLYSQADLEVAQELATRAAVAVDNARLYEQAQASLEALRASEHRYAQILDSVQDLVITRAPGSRTTWANKAACDYYGLSLHQLRRDSSATFDPRDVEVFETGHAVDIPHDPNRRADGEIRYFHTVKTPIFDRHGKVIEVVSVSRDVTERSELEARVRSARRTALRAEIMAALSTPGSVEQMLDATANAFASHFKAELAELWIEDEGDAIVRRASGGPGAPFATEPALRIEALAQRGASVSNAPVADGLLHDVSWVHERGIRSVAVLPLRSGMHVKGAVAVYMTSAASAALLDILGGIGDAVAQGVAARTAHLALERHAQELARSNRDLEQFAYVASHDLQEPLRMVSSYVQLLARRYKGKLDGDADDFIHFAVDGVTRMQTLINDLLAFSRVGTRTQNLQPVPLVAPVSAAVQTLADSIQRAQAVVQFDPEMPSVLGDQTQLVQLFQNLIGNALKFRRDEPPRIEIRADRDGDQWRVAVADNGIGIAEEYRLKIFDIFQRLHTRVEFPGNGIGLAICKRIVERHGGRIWVDSTVGAGSTLYFTLPAPPDRTERR